MTEEDREISALALVRLIARMQTEFEQKDGGASEDFRAALNSLIDMAREITGIEPGYPQVYTGWDEE